MYRRPFSGSNNATFQAQERSEECVGYAVTAVSPNRQIFVITVVWIGGVECVDVLESEAATFKVSTMDTE